MEKYHADILKAAYENNMSEAIAMNILQDAGVISDNCVWVKDIAEADAPAAIKFLQNYDHNTGQSVPR